MCTDPCICSTATRSILRGWPCSSAVPGCSRTAVRRVKQRLLPGADSAAPGGLRRFHPFNQAWFLAFSILLGIGTALHLYTARPVPLKKGLENLPADVAGWRLSESGQQSAVLPGNQYLFRCRNSSGTEVRARGRISRIPGRRAKARSSPAPSFPGRGPSRPPRGVRPRHGQSQYGRRPGAGPGRGPAFLVPRERPYTCGPEPGQVVQRPGRSSPAKEQRRPGPPVRHHPSGGTGADAYGYEGPGREASPSAGRVHPVNPSKTNIRLLEETDREAWDRYVAESGDASCYHLSCWKADRREELRPPDALHPGRGRQAPGHGQSFPLVHLKSLLFGNFMVSLPYFNYGGICTDRGGEPLPAVPQGRRALPGSGRRAPRAAPDRPIAGLPVKTSKVSMRLALPATPAELWDSFPAKLRSQVRRPAKEGMYATVGRAEELEGFYAVFADTMRDLGTPGLFAALLREHPAGTIPHPGSAWSRRRSTNPWPAGFLVGFKDDARDPLGLVAQALQPRKPQHAALQQRRCPSRARKATASSTSAGPASAAAPTGSRSSGGRVPLSSTGTTG